MFEVADEIEASAVAGIVPAQGSVMIANRPFFAVCDVQNNGVSDISNSKATIEFKHKTIPNYTKTYEMVISDIPSGAYNRKTIKFLGESVILEHPGEYTGTLTIKASGDVKTENDVITFSFTVESSVSGTFKVGTGQDFTTIQDAMDYLYLKGIDGSVNLVLTDAVYEIESPDELSPAWDFTTSIMGLGKQEDGTINKLTIRASDERAVSRGGVTIRLKTKNGQGVVFGQRIVNNSKNAVVREELSGEQFRQYANSPGYIEFDGGSNKSLRFELYSTNKHHGSAFYLNRGSQNIKIQNVLIDNKTPELKNQVYIPHVFHSDADGFIFEKDSAASQSKIEGYSAGIASRSSLFDQLVVIFDEEGNPLENLPEVEGERRQIVLDTIPNSNNTFMNNEIKGFGYGIFITGIGVLYYPPKSSYYRFYNSNNVIKNNIISEVGRSGIFAGYEENLEIRNNIIYNVSGGGDGRGSGIQLGQSPRGKYKGYNNIGVKVIGNTIQDIRGSEYVNGIRIEQGITEFSDPTVGVIRFPNAKDDINVNSNGIWNIKPNLSQTERTGIYAFTQRLDDKNDYTKLTTPLYADKMIEDLKVTNNTILFNEDGLLNNGKYFGVGIQQSNNAIFANNAIAIEDKTSNSSTIHSALFIQGDHPNHGFIRSDNNAYWVEGSGCDVIRFIESIPMTINNKVQTGFIHEGFNGEYQTIRQWRNWIGMDRHSSTSSNFMNNYSFVGTPSKLYMASPIPYASVLNNRGMRIDGDNVDMYGTKRGASGESFDIGAIEFNGIMYNLDNEIVDIEAPANYRESLGKYSGCEYVMTKAPVEIKSYLRNNGSLSQNSIPVTVKIERDDNGTMHEVLKETVTVNTPAYGYSDVYFNLANNEGTEFKPETYAELDKAIDDASFYGMEENVTPIYKITVTAGDDQNNINNVSTKYIRFFIERSHVGMLECNELLTSNLTSSNPNELAANLNAKAFEDGMRSIGYYNVTRKEAQTNKLNNAGVDTVYVQNIDRFNRNSWPERSIDYTGYRTVIWTDGDNDRLTRYQAMALKNFVEAGSESDKNNLVVLSQEIIRNNEGLDIDYDFSSTVFHAQGKNPQSPLGVDVNGNFISYAGKSVTGVNVERNLSENIIATGVAGDSNPQPGLLSLVEGAGNTRVAYVYNEPTTAPESNRIMGIAHSRTDRNILLYAIDWRHFEDIESVLRATYDYLEKNGSNPVPVDLLSFDGKQVGNAIELLWSTASETNSSYFDVERRLISETDYKSLDRVDAAGNSSNIRHYGMKDESVNFGNTYVYRLKLVEADGSFNYSNEATVKMESMKGAMSMSDIKPYPVSSASTFEINLSSATTVKIEMFNTQGKSVGILFEGTLSGSTKFDINASQFPAGVYSMVVTNGESTLTKSVHIIK